MNLPKDLMTIKQSSRETGLPMRALSTAVENGKLRAVVIETGPKKSITRILREDLELFLRGNRMPPCSGSACA